MYCATCGTQAPNLGERCGRCGSPLAGPAAGMRPDLPAPGDLYGRPPLPGAAAFVTPFVSPYAGFWLRVVAWVIDVVVMSFLAGGVALLAWLAGAYEQVDGGTLALGIWGLALAGCVLMEASPLQATPGKLALELKVTDAEGHRLGPGRALARVVGKVLSVLTLGIGYVMAGATKRRQAWHDRLAGALVVRRAAGPERLAEVPEAPHVSLWLPVMGALAAGVPLAAMVAAIAIPAYQDYTIRAQVAEGLEAASALKPLVAAAHARQGAWPRDLDALGGAAMASASSRYLESIVIEDGAIVLTFGGNAHDAIAGDRLGLVPAALPAGKVAWVCGYGSVPEDATPAHEDPAGFTSLDSRFLPESCLD